MTVVMSDSVALIILLLIASINVEVYGHFNGLRPEHVLKPHWRNLIHLGTRLVGDHFGERIGFRPPLAPSSCWSKPLSQINHHWKGGFGGQSNFGNGNVGLHIGIPSIPPVQMTHPGGKLGIGFDGSSFGGIPQWGINGLGPSFANQFQSNAASNFFSQSSSSSFSNAGSGQFGFGGFGNGQGIGGFGGPFAPSIAWSLPSSSNRFGNGFPQIGFGGGPSFGINGPGVGFGFSTPNIGVGLSGSFGGLSPPLAPSAAWSLPFGTNIPFGAQGSGLNTGLSGTGLNFGHGGIGGPAGYGSPWAPSAAWSLPLGSGQPMSPFSGNAAFGMNSQFNGQQQSQFNSFGQLGNFINEGPIGPLSPVGLPNMNTGGQGGLFNGGLGPMPQMNGFQPVPGMAGFGPIAPSAAWSLPFLGGPGFNLPGFGQSGFSSQLMGGNSYGPGIGPVTPGGVMAPIGGVGPGIGGSFGTGMFAS